MSQLPDYVASAQPNSKENRVGWLMTTAASYAGVMLWFAFWQDVPSGGQPVLGGILSQGLPLAIVSVIIAAFLCHFLCYLVPGMFGMKTGLSLSVVGTSTFGVKGGFIMPGFLMGVLQFGWLSVNAYFAGMLLAGMAGQPGGSITHHAISILWILGATFVGMKGVRYVGAVASFTPILPIIVLALLLANTIGGVGKFDHEKMAGELEAKKPKLVAALETSDALAVGAEGKLNAEQYEAIKNESIAKPVAWYGNQTLGVIFLACAYIIGFFATAGAAGVGFGSNNKDGKSIQLAGLVGIVFVTSLTAIIALIVFASTFDTVNLAKIPTEYRVTQLLETILGTNLGKACMLMLALAAFPSACFPTVVAADAFKTTFPKINPLITCGLGVLAAIVLSVTGLAGKAGDVFTVVGASFGPICGAMAADYLLSGKRWAGPRDGFNMPGWIAWFFGFIVGGATLVVEKFMGQTMPIEIPCPPLAAFIVGFVLYFICAKAGMESKVLDMPQRIDLGDEVAEA